MFTGITSVVLDTHGDVLIGLYDTMRLGYTGALANSASPVCSSVFVNTLNCCSVWLALYCGCVVSHTSGVSHSPPSTFCVNKLAYLPLH